MTHILPFAPLTAIRLCWQSSQRSVIYVYGPTEGAASDTFSHPFERNSRSSSFHSFHVFLFVKRHKMSLNKFMHPRNIYRTRTNFKELAIEFPEFRQHANQDVSGKVTIDFTNPEALRALTTSLLKRDFDLNVNIPSNHLVPTLPSRLNYIHWLEDILAILPSDCTPPGDVIRGIDIGTGVACIYPLLGFTMNKWHFLATEVDEEAFTSASRNVATNQLEGFITVVRPSDTSSPLLNAVNCQPDPEDDTYTFSMCNPPFFADEHEANPVTKGRNPSKRTPPRSCNAANSAESITSGGEVEFVSALITDSIQLGSRIGIYSTLLGKKSSLATVKGMLVEKGIKNFVTTEFCQGKTMRWGIAWTFWHQVSLSNVPKMKRQPKTRPLTIEMPRHESNGSYTVPDVLKRVKQLLTQLKMTISRHSSNGSSASFEFSAASVTWAHQRRQRRALLMGEKPGTAQEQDNEETSEANGLFTDAKSEAARPPVLRCKVCIREIGERIITEMHWLGGDLGRDSMHQVLQFLKNKFK